MVLSTRLKDAEMIGEEKKARKIAINMLKKSLDLTTIVECTNLSEADIRSIAQDNCLEVKE